MKFFRKHQKAIVATLAGLMALLMILPMLANIVGVALAATPEDLKAELNQMRNEANELAQDKKQLNQQLKDIQADKNKAVEKKNLVEQQINVIRAELANSDRQLAQYDQLIVEKTEELALAEEKEAQYFDLFCERVRYMEEGGEVTYWSILFNAADFSDLLDRITLVNDVMEYDNAVMDMLEESRRQVSEAKSQLEADRAAQQEVRNTQAARKKELDGKLVEADALVDEISGKEDEAEAALKALEAAAAAMDREIAAKQKEWEAKVASGSVTINAGTGYLWPLKGYNTLSSLFGNRIHPILNKPMKHSGIDIPAPRGTNILAARGGVVITSTYSNSYGNYVVVSHGNNESTLYAHMNSRAVKEGDVVSQGQVLGYVGTTGRSTGNHLHFEVRINGTRVDAVNYYPGMTLYIRSGGKTVLLEH